MDVRLPKPNPDWKKLSKRITRLIKANKLDKIYRIAGLIKDSQ